MAVLARNRNTILVILFFILLFGLALQGTSPATLVAILLSGLTLGALYFLVAGGLSLIFGLMDVLNFAHGSLFMFGAYAGWTFFINPRLIFNTAPLLLVLAAPLVLHPLIARRLTLPRAGRWVAGAIAAGLLFLALRDFPLDKLVAMGASMTGKVIETAQAEDPLLGMLGRLALFLVAGLVVTLALGPSRDAERVNHPRVLGLAAGLLVVGVAMLVWRDALEQSILGMENTGRFILALLVGAGTGAILGAAMEWGLIRPLYKRPIYQVLLTLGLVFVADQVVRSVWGPAGAFMDMPTLFNTDSPNCPSPDLFAWFSQHCNSILVLGRPFPSYRAFIILIGLLIVIAVILLMQRTRLGMIIRAGVQDSEMVEALGINVRRIFTLVFAIGAGLAGLGGVVAAPFLGVYPGMAMEFLLQAFIVIVIGGMGSIPGAALGAVLVGLARAYGDHLVLAGVQLPFMSEAVSGSPAIARASTVLLMAIVLMIKPTGIFGKKE